LTNNKQTADEEVTVTEIDRVRNALLWWEYAVRCLWLYKTKCLQRFRAYMTRMVGRWWWRSPIQHCSPLTSFDTEFQLPRSGYSYSRDWTRINCTGLYCITVTSSLVHYVMLGK